MFLDLVRDRYFCLAERDEAGFRALASGAPDCDPAVATRLCGLGLVEPAAAPALCRCLPLKRPTNSLLDEEGRDSSDWSLVVRAAFALAGARHRLRRRGLATAIAQLERRRRDREVDSAVAAYATGEIARAFERLALLVSPMDQCLPRSLALAGMLFARGFAAQFVIGVQLRPFLAHSWVQSGTLVVNERVDIARAFTPILVV